MRKVSVFLSAASCLGLAACGSAELGGSANLQAEPMPDCTPSCLVPPPDPPPEARVMTVNRDRGGMMLKYSLHMMKLRESGTKVKFAGRCDSACTIYLSLPRHQTCIASGAMFGFHSPSAGEREASVIAQAYLMENYPDWVKEWIASKGGLSRDMMVMDYAYASQYLDSCDEVLVTAASLGRLRSNSPGAYP